MRPLPWLLLLGIALAAGLGLGYGARRLAARVSLPPRLARPPALLGALEAFEAGDRARLLAAADALADVELGAEELVAEAELLVALAQGEETRLEEVVRRRPGTSAAARALVLLAQRATDEAGRLARRDAFARAFPASWMLGAGKTP